MAEQPRQMTFFAQKYGTCWFNSVLNAIINSETLIPKIGTKTERTAGKA